MLLRSQSGDPNFRSGGGGQKKREFFARFTNPARFSPVKRTDGTHKKSCFFAPRPPDTKFRLARPQNLILKSSSDLQDTNAI